MTAKFWAFYEKLRPSLKHQWASKRGYNGRCDGHRFAESKWPDMRYCIRCGVVKFWQARYYSVDYKTHLGATWAYCVEDGNPASHGFVFDPWHRRWDRRLP